MKEDENQNPMDDYNQDNEDIDNLIERFNRDVCLDNKPVIQQEFENNNVSFFLIHKNRAFHF